MGDPKFPKKKYSTPRHPWKRERIDSEEELVKKYGLKSKRELWVSLAFLNSLRNQARDLQARMRSQDPNAPNQFQAMIKRLDRYSILSESASLDDVLSLTIEDVLERRLQTVVYKKNLASTLKQSRQLISHGHIEMEGRTVTIPGMMVERVYEPSIIYNTDSPLVDELHPIRQAIAGVAREEAEEEASSSGIEESEKSQEKEGGKE